MNTQTQMEKYRATRSFGMGGDIKVVHGMLIEFDGYSVAVAGRPKFALPTFVGAISKGWVVPEHSFDPTAPIEPPRSAGIRVRPADTGNPNDRRASSLITTAQAEEQIVTNVQSHASGVRHANQTRMYSGSGQGSMAIEPQDGIPVRTLRTAANSRDGARTTLTGSNTQQAINQAAAAAQVVPGRGMTREEMMERLTPDQRAAYQAEINARKSSYEAEAIEAETHAGLRRGPDAQGQVIASLNSTPGLVESEGIRTTTTVGGGTDTVDLSGLDGAPAETSVIQVEGMTFRTTNGPKKTAARPVAQAPAPASLEDIDPRRIIALSICRDFPDLYDFEAPQRRKLARLRADFEDRPDVIRAVAAAEDSEMKVALVTEFPEAFQATAP